MEFWSILILLISESSNQFFLIITSASITNIFTIVVSTSIIKNGVAEQSIRTVSEMECAMILHSCVLWKNGTGSNLWRTATSYSTYIYNHIPNAEEIAPADIFTGTKFPRHELKYIHVWGCPFYVQQGCKIPKWQAQLCRRIFFGFNPNH